MINAADIANYTIAATQGSFILALLPSLFNKKTVIHWSTSLWTGAGLVAIATSFMLLGLWLSALTTFGSAVMWFLLLVFRRGSSVYKADIESMYPIDTDTSDL
jgi:hypothetical protein